jgi:hypothetical protein
MNAREGMGELVRAQTQGEEGEGRKVFYRCVSRGGGEDIDIG